MRLDLALTATVATRPAGRRRRRAGDPGPGGRGRARLRRRRLRPGGQEEPSSDIWRDDAIVIQPEPANARESFEAAPGRLRRTIPKLEWWPVWAGISASGDLGFTTGPVQRRRQAPRPLFHDLEEAADGQWKWVFDGGVGSDPAQRAGPDSTPGICRSPRCAGSIPKAPWPREGRPKRPSPQKPKTDSKAAYLEVLACDARLQGSPMAAGHGLFDLRAGAGLARETDQLHASGRRGIGGRRHGLDLWRSRRMDQGRRSQCRRTTSASGSAGRRAGGWSSTNC
jgi:hypothetical protein